MNGALEGDQAASDRVGSRQKRKVCLYGREWRDQSMVLPTLCIRIVSCGKQIELNRLQQLEQSVIRRFPNALNKCRHPASTHSLRVLQSSVDLDKHAKDTARKADRKGYDDSRVDTAVTYVNSLSTGLQVTHLINYAMNTCLTIAWHSSYPWSSTQSARRWGGSMVVLLDRAGHSFTGKLRAALTHSARWPAGQRN